MSDANPSWAKHHADFEHIFLLDSDCDVLSRKSDLSMVRSAYRALRVGAQRADLCRLLAIHAHGGVYVDTDAIAYRHLNTAVPSWASFFVTEWGAFELFGATAGHPFVERAINVVVSNIADEIARCRQERRCCKGAHACIVRLTGPKAFFDSIVASGRAHHCLNRKWIPKSCGGSSSADARGYFRCIDTGMRTNRFKTTMCGVARHADCRNSGIGKPCAKEHYARHSAPFFDYAVDIQSSDPVPSSPKSL